MRFSNWMPLVVLLSSAVYIIGLGVRGDLDLYIHPRYTLFTLVMAAICVIVLCVLHLSSQSYTTNAKDIGWLPMWLMLAGGLLLPATSLSSATVAQRTVDDVVAVNRASNQSTANLFTGSSRALSLNDWARLLSINSSEDYYANKTAKVSGFVYDADFGSDTVLLARFVVTCCAVDAQPIGVPVQLEDWHDTYAEDEWLEVEGLFKNTMTDDGEKLTLIPSDVRQIEEPDNPYAN